MTTMNSSILDEILFEERYYRDEQRAIPKRLYINPTSYAELIEALGIDPFNGLEHYHNMEIVVTEDVEEIEIE